MESLSRLGWNARLAAELIDRPALRPARVAAEHRGRFEIWGASEEPMEAELGGRLRHGAVQREDLPVVGDWVGVRLAAGRAIVDRVLSRASLLVRKAVGRSSQRQPLAANVDRMLIVTTPDADFSPRRMERYLTVAWEGGAQPVIVLGKIDLVDEPAPFVDALAAVAPGVEVLPVSAVDGRGLDALAARAAPGSTLALVGSSGVGKSTLVNALAGATLQGTAEVRAGDGKGRHTTTGRQMILLPGGALVVDTPGMRELGLAGDGTGDGLAGAFADVEALAAACRFRDCGHGDEPGCAVRAAVAAGDLDEARWQGFTRLAEEAARQALRHDARAMRRISRDLRARAKHDPKLRD